MRRSRVRATWVESVECKWAGDVESLQFGCKSSGDGVREGGAQIDRALQQTATRYLECGRDERAVKSTESSFVLEGGRTLSIETKEAGVDWRKANKSTGWQKSRGGRRLNEGPHVKCVTARRWDALDGHQRVERPTVGSKSLVALLERLGRYPIVESRLPGHRLLVLGT